MPIDPSISLNAKAPDSMSSLSSILNIANSAQSLKKQQATFDADISQRKAESQQSQTQADIAQQTAPAQIQEMQSRAHAALLALNDSQRQSVGTFVASLANSDPKTVFTKLDGLAEFQPELKPAIDYMKTVHLAPAANDPKAFANIVKQVGIGTMTVPEQFRARTAEGPTVTNNQQAATVNQNPGADTPVGQVAPGTAVQMQIPVGTQVFNPTTNAPAITGPGGGPGPQAGPALGAPEAALVPVKAVADDWATTTTEAKNASQTIGLLQDIKQHAQGASVGIGAERRAIVNGIAGYLGSDANQLSKTDTDLLAKDSNILALAGGDTNLAKDLASMANPNIHMTKDAIQSASDKVIGIQKMRLAKQQFLQPTAADPAAYSQRLAQFNKAADPRTFEFASKDPDERRAMLKRMSPADKADLKTKMEALHQLGIAP